MVAWLQTPTSGVFAHFRYKGCRPSQRGGNFPAAFFIAFLIFSEPNLYFNYIEHNYLLTSKELIYGLHHISLDS